MCAQRVQLKTTIDGAQVPLNPYTDCVKNVRQQMPLAGSKLLGTTVLYVGPATDTYDTGVCYTCKATESNSYYWEKVQTAAASDVDLSVLPTTVRFQSQGINTKGAVLTVDSTGFKFRQDSQGLGCTRLFTAGFGFIRYAGGDLHISTSAVSRVFSISTDAASELSISAGSTLYTEQGKVILPARIGISGVNSQSANAGCVSIYPSCIRDTAMQNGPALSVWQSGVYWDGAALATTADIDTHATLTASSDTLGHIKVDNETITVDENGVATAHAVGHNIFDIFYSMSSKAPAGAMDLSLGTLIASCDTVFPDFWSQCLQRRGNAHMFPQFSSDGWYYWSDDNVIGINGISGYGNAVCCYEGKIYVLAWYQYNRETTPPSQSALWRQFIAPTEQWDAQKQYSIGDTVLHNGQIWCARSDGLDSGYVGIAPGTTDADGDHHWALYDLPTQIVAPSIRILTESEWQAEVTANGSCGAFVVDQEAKSVRLPKITNMVQPGDVGVFMEAGLPNINGQLLTRPPLANTTSGTGALYYGSNNTEGYSAPRGDASTTNQIYFDASKSNSIYGNSTTVQPPAVGAKLYIQVFTSAVPASMAQAGEFINMLQAKADRTELDSYLPLTGGTVTGTIVTTNISNTITSNSERIIITGGSTNLKGGNLRLYGDGYTGSSMTGGFALVTHKDETQGPALTGKPDGTLVWDNVSVLNPIGTVIAFAGNSAPDGYLICNGAELSRTTYAKLFEVIGIRYGEGDGSTTFNLPNLTNKFIMGSTTVGTSKSAGLPDIDGTFVLRRGGSSGTTSLRIASSGAFSADTSNTTTSAIIWNATSYSSALVGTNFTFKASRSSSIYKASLNTVQPPALTMRFYIKY